MVLFNQLVQIARSVLHDSSGKHDIHCSIVLYHLVIALLKIRILKECVRRRIHKDGGDKIDQQVAQPNPVAPPITQSVVTLHSLNEQEEIKEPLLSS